MRALSRLGPLVLVLGLTQLSAQSPSKSALVKLDSSLDAIVSPTAEIEILKEEYFGLAEGPLWINEGASGYLLLSDVGANDIYRWTPDGTLSAFLQKTGWSGTDTTTLHTYIRPTGGTTFGSNGITLDRQGRLVWAAQGDRAVIRQERDGTRTVLADRYQGKRFSRPNDVIVKSDGSVYFTDLPGATTIKELDFNGVFLIKDGNVRVVERELTPNGLALSPDEKYFYVNHFEGGGKIYRYDVMSDGALANRRVFVDMTVDKAPGGADGVKVDQRGNLYSTGPGGVWIISADGKHLGTISTATIGVMTNVAFGDPDGKTLYLTARRTLARIRVNVPGVRPHEGLLAPIEGRAK